MILIRNMIIDDYDSVYQLWNDTPGMGLNDMDDSRFGIEKYLHRNPGTCFVAICENEIIGSILSGHDGRRGFIYHLAVAESYRKQGTGKALVENAMSALEMEGIHKVALVVFKKNNLGNDFWESQDFIKRDDLTYRNKSIKIDFN